MKKTVECTYCDGAAKIKMEKKDISYRKEEFCINQYFYKCEKCKEEFTTNELDDMSLLQVHNQYRAMHLIPFVEEIVKTKERYGLSAAKMNEVLGLGANSYSNFEKGDMPSLAIASLLRLAQKPPVFKEMALGKKDVFSEKSFEELIRRIDDQIAEESKNLIRIDVLNRPCSLNGFRRLDIDRISNLLCYYLSSCARNFNDKLKLNKLLFYTDFLNYKESGYSITGLSYRAINHGPVPSFYDMLFTYLHDENYIETDWEQSENRGGIEIFIPKNGYDLNVFSENEMEVIHLIQTKFKNVPSWDLRNASHEEIGWKECFPNKEIIDYQKYAYAIGI